MAYQSKTYSLSDEVVAAIEEARGRGLTPNQFLRRVLGIGGVEGVEVRINGRLLNSTEYSVSDNGTITLDDKLSIDSTPLARELVTELNYGDGK